MSVWDFLFPCLHWVRRHIQLWVHGDTVMVCPQGGETTRFCTLVASPDASTVDDWSALSFYRTFKLAASMSTTLERSSSPRLSTQQLEALIQYIKQIVYIKVGYIWGQMVATPELPPPRHANGCGFNVILVGGKCSGPPFQRRPKPPHQFLRCGCKKGCRGQCQCHICHIPVHSSVPLQRTVL
jgi:hypothetical protein